MANISLWTKFDSSPCSSIAGFIILIFFLIDFCNYCVMRHEGQFLNWHDVRKKSSITKSLMKEYQLICSVMLGSEWSWKGLLLLTMTDNISATCVEVIGRAE